MNNFKISNLSQTFEDLEKLETDIKMKNQAVIYLTDENNELFDSEELKSLIQSEAKKYKELSGNENISELEALKIMLSADKIRQNREISDLKKLSIEAYSHDNLNADHLLSVLNVTQHYNQEFSVRDYAEVLLATKNDEDYNLIMENGLNTDPEINFKSRVFNEMLNMNNYINNSRLVENFALQSVLSDMSSYYSSNKERSEEFLSLAAKNDVFGEPLIKNDLTTSILFGQEFDLSLVEQNTENKNNMAQIIKNVLVNSLDYVDGYLHESMAKEISLFYVQKFDDKKMLQFLSEQDLNGIFNDINKTIENKNTHSEEKLFLNNWNNFTKEKVNFIVNERENLEFKDKFTNEENTLIEIKKEKEIINSILDCIDYDDHDVSVFENNLIIAKVDDVFSELNKLFPNIKNVSPSEEEKQLIKEEKIILLNNLELKEIDALNSLKSKLSNEINSFLIKGETLQENNVVGYLNSLDDKFIDDFGLRVLVLGKSNNENEFNDLFKQLNGEHKINFEHGVLKTLLTDNSIYESIDKDGYIINNIEKLIKEQSDKPYFNLSSYLLTTPEVSNFAIDYQKEFKQIYPTDVLNDTLKRMSNVITNKLVLNAISEHQAGSEDRAVQSIKLLKLLNGKFDNQQLLKDINDNLSKMGDFKDAKFYKEYKSLIKPEAKKQLKMN